MQKLKTRWVGDASYWGSNGWCLTTGRKTIFQTLGIADRYLRMVGKFSDYKNYLDIPGFQPSIDNASIENKRRLKQFGGQLVSNNGKKFQEFIDK